jgi:uroporphyrinogen-III synthase
VSRGPLSGRTIVVTRASDQAGSFTAILRDAGAEVVEVPLIRIVEAPDGGQALRVALGRLDEYDWLVVTSPNGAQRVQDALATQPIGHPLVAAVGSATSAALAPRRADLVPPRQLAESLVKVFPEGSGRVLAAQATQARDELAHGLTEKGWRVERVGAYDTERLAIPPDLVDAIGRADAITFLSGSAVTSFAAAWPATELPVPCHAVSIGPVTSAVAETLGFSVTATARSHTLRGTLETLIRVLT